MSRNGIDVGFLESAVHAFDLTVRSGTIDLGRAVHDAMHGSTGRTCG